MRSYALKEEPGIKEEIPNCLKETERQKRREEIWETRQKIKKKNDESARSNSNLMLQPEGVTKIALDCAYYQIASGAYCKAANHNLSLYIYI